MVGGNLPATTRTMTIAIGMEAGLGHHDRALAYSFTCCSSAWSHIDAGRVLQDDAAAEVFGNPRNRRVAEIGFSAPMIARTRLRAAAPNRCSWRQRHSAATGQFEAASSPQQGSSR
jgi:hypothetical protein